MLTSIRGTQDSEFLWWPGKHCYSLAGKFWFIHCIHQTFHLQISIYSSLYKILLMEKTSIPWKTVKNHLEQFFVQKDKKFWEDGIMKLPEKWQKIVEKNDSTTILVNMLFNKVLGKNEKCVFYFYLKRNFLAKPIFLHSKNKSHLVVMYNLFNSCWILFANILLRFFVCISVHEGYWSIGFL